MAEVALQLWNPWSLTVTMLISCSNNINNQKVPAGTKFISFSLEKEYLTLKPDRNGFLYKIIGTHLYMRNNFFMAIRLFNCTKIWQPLLLRRHNYFLLILTHRYTQLYLLIYKQKHSSTQNFIDFFYKNFIN